MFFTLRAAAFMAACALLPTSALADEWIAAQLRGPVLQLIGKQWQPLQRGMAIPDLRTIRTLAAGHVTLTRGEETVELGPNTQIRIHDSGGAKPFTTVTQAYGTVSVEAEVENVQHFAVETPYMAAVVKGTRFTVTSGSTGASVSVRRGHVEVDDHRNRTHVTVGVGQTATVDKVKTDGQIDVSGQGKLPAVLDSKGKPFEPKGPGPKAPPPKKDKPAKLPKPEKPIHPPKAPGGPPHPEGDTHGHGGPGGNEGPGTGHDGKGPGHGDDD